MGHLRHGTSELGRLGWDTWVHCERLYGMFVISDWLAHWPVFMLFSQYENTFAAEKFKNRDTFL